MAKKRFDVGRNYEQLSKMMKLSSLTLRKPRQERNDMTRQLVGLHYSENGSSQSVPVNLIALYTQIVGPSLIANNPRVLLSTFNRDAKPTVAALSLEVNRQMKKLRVANVLRRVVTDALFSVGYCVVGLATPQDAAVTSWKLKAGMPYLAHIDPDNVLFDPHARDFEEVDWISYRIRIPLYVVQESRDFSKFRKELTGSPDALYNPEGDERISTIFRGYYSEAEELEDKVDLWLTYLPRHRVVVTQAADDSGGVQLHTAPLKEMAWIGPDSGPIHVLGYGTVPGNILPIAPLQNVFDLHMAVNNCWRKLIRQAQRMKQMTTYQAGSAEDSEQIRVADDGDLVPLVRPEGVRPLVTGGPEQTLLAIAEALKQLFDFMGGNVSLQGGLGPQSKTAHQDELLNENSSRVTQDRQETTLTYTSDVIEDLCWWLHHHPTLTVTGHEPVPGMPEMAIPRQATPADRRQVPFESMDIKVDPYSLVHQTPQSKLQQMQGVVTQIVIPMMQLMVQQGVSFDINRYLEILGSYMDLPELADILTIREPPPGMQQGGGGGAGAGPAQTTRNYNRTSTPGRTDQATARDRITTLMSGAKNGSSPGNGQMRMGGPQ